MSSWVIWLWFLKTLFKKGETFFEKSWKNWRSHDSTDNSKRRNAVLFEKSYHKWQPNDSMFRTQDSRKHMKIQIHNWWLTICLTGLSIKTCMWQVLCKLQANHNKIYYMEIKWCIRSFQCLLFWLSSSQNKRLITLKLLNDVCMIKQF